MHIKLYPFVETTWLGLGKYIFWNIINDNKNEPAKEKPLSNLCTYYFIESIKLQWKYTKSNNNIIFMTILEWTTTKTKKELLLIINVQNVVCLLRSKKFIVYKAKSEIHDSEIII